MHGKANAFLAFCDRIFQMPARHAENYTYSTEALDGSHIATPIKLGHEPFFGARGYTLEDYVPDDYVTNPFT